MKIITLLLVPCFCLVLTIPSYSQASKTTAQMFTIEKVVSKIKLNVANSNVEILRTKGSRVNIETSVKISGGNLALLDYLLNKGRYDLRTDTDPSKASLNLSPQKNNKVIIIKGEEIKEEVSYKIFIPENIVFVQTLDGEQLYAMSSKDK